VVFSLNLKTPQKSKDWYRSNLGIDSQDWGTSFYWFQSKEDKHPHLTNWSPFAQDADYFGDSGQEFMINYIVKDMDGLIAHLKAQNISLLKPKEVFEYGTFIWIKDSDGRRIELWEPILGIL